MTQHLKHYSVSACALAISLLISACGGADPADSVPPTVAITDNVPGATATGAVTFTFTFSEDVGSSFALEDVTITGGTAGTLTKVDAIRYTLIVTPATNSTGTINVGVGANKFKDLALNDNTVAASAQQAYDTTTAPPPSGNTGTCTAAPCNDFGAANLALVTFGDLSGEITNDPVDASNKVGKLTKVPASQTWAGATIDPSGSGVRVVPAIGFATSKIITLRVYSPAAGETIMMKVENSTDGGIFMEKQATTTQEMTWETLSFDFASPSAGSYDASKVYDRVSVFPHFGSSVSADSVYYIDELKYAAASAPPPSCGTTEPTCAPTTTIPSGAIVVYSETAAAAGLDAYPNWGQATQFSEVTLANNKSLKYSNLNYQGIQFDPIDVSSKGKVHFDLWSPDLTEVKIWLISAGPKENAVTQVITTKGWNSVDIDLSKYTAPDLKGIFQIKLEAAGSGTLYVDNIYFHGTAAGGGGGGAATFSAGFSSNGLTANGGGFGGFSGSNQDNFNCSGDPAFCGSGGDFTGGTGSYYFYYYQTPTPATQMYVGMYVLAPGVTAFNDAGDTAGVSVGSRANLKFTFNQNAEWFNSATNNFMIVVDLGKRYVVGGNTCRLQLRNVTTPTAAAATAYTIPWTAFDLVQNCGQSLTVAQALAASPVSQISFQGVGNTDRLPAGGKLSGANTSVAVNGVYPSTVVVSGAITFE